MKRRENIIILNNVKNGNLILFNLHFLTIPNIKHFTLFAKSTNLFDFIWLLPSN